MDYGLMYYLATVIGAISELIVFLVGLSTVGVIISVFWVSIFYG